MSVFITFIYALSSRVAEQAGYHCALIWSDRLRDFRSVCDQGPIQSVYVSGVTLQNPYVLERIRTLKVCCAGLGWVVLQKD